MSPLAVDPVPMINDPGAYMLNVFTRQPHQMMPPHEYNDTMIALAIWLAERDIQLTNDTGYFYWARMTEDQAFETKMRWG